MRVKCLVLDGFKSYAHRQELTNLDEHFNAITGLNGSGKSNIFDAICFVMGITNTKTLRAEDHRELIFKNGNAGIQKARVEIEFENCEPCAPGYPPSEYPTITVGRQIQVNGTQSFFLNNRKLDRSKIKQFFHNIGLNIENPHFMVLQGKVHKLIGMKSQDILGWLEEAAGTRVFDVRRRAAEQMIAGKAKRYQEIRRVRDEDIGPQVENLAVQQDQYNSFMAQVEGLEQKRKFKTAFQYYSAKKDAESAAQSIETAKERVEVAATKCNALPKEIDEATERISAVEEKLNAPNDELDSIVKQENEAKKNVAKTEELIKATEKNIKRSERELKKATEELAKTKKKLEQFMTSGERHRQEHEERQAVAAELQTQQEQLKRAMDLCKQGVQASGSGKTVQQELSDLNKAITTAQGELNRSREYLADLDRECEMLQQRIDKEEGSRGHDKQQLINAQKELEHCREQYHPYLESEDALRTVQQKIREADQEVRAKQNLAAQSGGNTLDYDRRPGVDLDKDIHGRVGELVTCSDARYSVALSTGTGRNVLDRVVVTHDGIAQALIDSRLKNRAYFVPLNKAQGRIPITSEKLNEAKKIAASMGGAAELGLNLIQYDNKYSNVLEPIFGAFIVCDSVQLAKEIAYSNKVRCKAVTLDGDVADPNGVMHGGAASQNQDHLARHARAAQGRIPFERAVQHRQQLQQQLVNLQRKLQEGNRLRQAFEDAENRLHMIKNKFENSGTAKLVKDLQDNGNRREEVSVAIEKRQTELQRLQTRLTEVKAQEGVDPQQKFKEMSAEYQKCAEQLRKQQLLIDTGATEFDNLQAQKETLEQSAEDSANEVQEKETERNANQTELEQLKSDLGQSKEHVVELEARRQVEDAKNLELEEEKTAASELLATLRESLEVAQKAVKDGETTVKQLNRNRDEGKKIMRDIAAMHGWIEGEEESFGAADGPFFFEDEERTQQTLAELQEAEAASEQLGRKVNKKATVLYDQYKKEYDDLNKQSTTLSEDKEIILSSITTIDTHKWTSLDNMVKKVSAKFSDLFAMCLPGASCRLVETRDPDTKRLTGLEVRVAFNGKEKDTLMELSGGQRSLLALCLILAILRCRKAPIYILDEVDAALDPSHTQNIGKMLHHHFPDAQFLLVSLKDGMFDNADVIYQIRNTQGYSEIARVENKKKK